ncbi:major facilitator family protein [Verticillium alfalfae VaMs.102]|uniref:Major facilitator family protein n=1 Tax=Verticillium alfalfae (strain VaMs.102 / ATCC MYA-4576 / FGSC 10136) TaxID=526221 RepID=C9SP68_VERA1|nr:major facilitator family protein [Verticillium alfalfae VaMs.102]EEY20583.1 major facilitator family protein [Verticillium alfalfae VaMs.102]
MTRHSPYDSTYCSLQRLNVDFETASTVATLMQSGYAVGLFSICPIGYWLQPRPLILVMVGVTATLLPRSLSYPSSAAKSRPTDVQVQYKSAPLGSFSGPYWVGCSPQSRPTTATGEAYTGRARRSISPPCLLVLLHARLPIKGS